MRTFVAATVALGLSVSVEAALHTQTIEYKQGDTTLEGYLAYDDASTTKRPGVLIVHDWMGVGPFVKGHADELARMGYVAFAADIYGKDVRPKNTKVAGEQAGVDWQLVIDSGAVHAFTNPDAGTDNSKGAAYNARADRRSWEVMKQFFAEIFR